MILLRNQTKMMKKKESAKNAIVPIFECKKVTLTNAKSTCQFTENKFFFGSFILFVNARSWKIKKM